MFPLTFIEIMLNMSKYMKTLALRTTDLRNANTGVCFSWTFIPHLIYIQGKNVINKL